MFSPHHRQIIAGLTPGKPTEYPHHYDATLLQAVPRSMNREPLGLHAHRLPFHGADIWTLYELSWLNNKGLPQVALGELSLDACSTHLIESKSLKLYLNGLNQTRFTDWEAVRTLLKRDLSHCAQGAVKIRLLPLDQMTHQPIANLSGESLDEQDIEINNYTLNNTYLKNATGKQRVEETLVSHLLKSNCLITHQPDWGSIQIRYRGPQINREALLRYLVSFRHHDEFHEQCVERIFNDLLYFCKPETLAVYARYTRRGGLDINPWRANCHYVPLTGRLARQ